MLWRFFNAFDLNPRLALVATTSVCLATIAAFAMHLGAPWWAAISAWIVAHADHQRWWGKSVQRVLASIAGSFGGYQLMVVFQSDPFIQFLCIFSLGVLGLYKSFTSANHSYAWLLGTVTAIVVMMSGLGDIADLYNIAVERAFEVSVGVVSAGIIAGLFTVKTGPLQAGSGKPRLADNSEIDRETYVWIIAIAGGLTLALVPVIDEALQIPGMKQIAITISVSLYAQDLRIANVGYKRVAGCFLGGLVAIGLLAIGIESLFVLLIVTFAFMFVASGLHFGDPLWAAIGTQAGIAFLVCMMSSVGPPESILPVIHRLTGMLTALACVILFTIVLERSYLYISARKKRMVADL